MEAEGVSEFREKFGSKAYGLHHRFYFHLDDETACGCRLRTDARICRRRQLNHTMTELE